MPSQYKHINKKLLLGDWLALLLVTLIGFFNHNQQFLLVRYLATALPLCLTWLLSAPWFGLLAQSSTGMSTVWWRVILAISLSTPLALLIRAILLGSSIEVSFSLVMIATSALAIILWRLLWRKVFKQF
ncbi:MAG: hypothetical protein BGO78_09150 [Chloroflexi bacterium 44-23]|nr:MAG: hypothetical protein BGO78_09150 [Chloroflexi bacterium 44-23]